MTLDLYEELYLTIYGAGSDADAPDPPNFTATVQYAEDNYTFDDVILEWSPPIMAGATHVAIFRRSGTDIITQFEPSPDIEYARVPVNTTVYNDENMAAGDYVYQAFPLMEV